ncbi:FAD-binding oxidoreductase [Pendulispora albinea]|uniref:FAD-binding oxidoreductase n=1 Tax=Pendulispora albinea TaxID=2741071 RepID=A0ABZ2M1T1_9BACT
MANVTDATNADAAEGAEGTRATAVVAHPAHARDAILGVAPRMTYAPESAEACAGVMAECARERLRVGFIGGGTELSLGYPPEGLDAVIRTGAMRRVLEYAPADMVIAVEAGVTLAELQAVTRAERQMLALDAPFPERATLGGLVATGAFGPRRARYGAVRDVIIGVTLVRADGVVARGGGKVVKNVAGFDLPKVACGALGTLGLVATATFRLHPLPDATATALFAGLPPDAIVALVGRMRQAQLEPSSVVAIAEGAAGSFDLGVRFEGFDQGVAHQMKRVAELDAAHPLSDDDAASFWTRHDRARDGALRIKLAALPSQLPAVAARVAPLMDALHGGTFAWYATLGLGFVGGTVADPEAAAAAMQRAREALTAEGGSLVVIDAPSAVRAHVDPWGPKPGSFPVMAELKQRFDPERRLNPGRFLGGL